MIALTLVVASLTAVHPSGPVDDQARAGYPQETSWFARPIDNKRSIGYYVGGGAANRHKAEPASSYDGTWGWDYSGGLIRRRVDNGWWHGRRYQGGIGAYKTDGPKLPE